jgi:phage shock protein A
MSLMRRMRDITVATLNERLEQAEDPIKLIDQYLMTQREQITETEKLHRQMMAHAQTLRQQMLGAEQMKEKREQQAMIALKAGEEHVARMALQEKLQHEETYAQFKELYEQCKHSIVELEEQLAQMKRDFDEVLSRRQYYMAKLETIRLQQKLNESMRGGNLALGGRAFYRLEERLSDLEIEAKALRDVRQMGGEHSFTGGALRQSVEHEMSRLKQKLEKEGWSS